MPAPLPAGFVLDGPAPIAPPITAPAVAPVPAGFQLDQPPPQAHTLAPAPLPDPAAPIPGMVVPLTPPVTAAPPAPAPDVSMADRFTAHLTHSAQHGTIQGAMGNVFDAANQDQIVKNLREQGQTEAADRYQAAGVAANANEQHKFDAMPAWNSGGSFIDKAKAGTAALAGELAGGALSPEGMVTKLPGMAGHLMDVIAEKVAAKILPHAAAPAGVRVLAAGGGQAAVNTATDPVIQAANIKTGAQDHYDPMQTALAPAFGFLLGAGIHGATELPGGIKGIADTFRAWRDAKGTKAAPDLAPTPDEISAFEASPELKAHMAANGITDPKDPRMVQLQDRLAKQTEAVTVTGYRKQDAGGSSTPAFHGDEARLAQERTAAADGDIDPAAASTAGRTPVAPLPPVIPVHSTGQADVGDLGVKAGMGKAAEVKADIDTKASQAFTLADRQRRRAAPDVRDTQPAARPEGADQQQVVLDEGFPVQVQARKHVEVAGRTVEMATVHRYDPRTGELDPEAVPYDVPVRQLKTGNYATDPRQAQDFEARAAGPKTPENTRTPAQPVTREPAQTYRATPADANQDFPGATRPGAEDGGLPEGRSPLPKQPEGPHPGPARPTREEEVIRDFAAREEARKRQDWAGAGKSGAKARDYRSADDTASSQAKAPGADSRFEVDDRGYVASDKGGPVRFSDQKQAAKWIINEGHKKSPDQIFEIENHPSGKGFTVHERGRSEPSKEPPPSDGTSSQAAKGARAGEGVASPGAPSPPLRLEGPKAAEPEPKASDEVPAEPKAAEPNVEVQPDLHEHQSQVDAAVDSLSDQDKENVHAEGYQHSSDAGEGKEQSASPEEGAPKSEDVASGENHDSAGDSATSVSDHEAGTGAGDHPASDAPDAGRVEPDKKAQDDMFKDDAQKGAASKARDTFYSNPIGDPENWRLLGDTLHSAFGWAKEEAAAWSRSIERMADTMPKWETEGDGVFSKAWNATLPVRHKLEVAFYSNDGVLRSMAARAKSKTMDDIANMFFAAPRGGKEAIGNDYFHDMRQKQSVWNNRLDKALTPFQKMNRAERADTMSQIGKLVQHPGAIKAGTPIHDAAREIGKILKEVHTYMREAGVEVGEVKNGYLPRVENIEAILKKPDAFKAAAKRAFMADGISPKDAAAAADDWLHRVLLGDLGIHHEGNDFVQAGGGTSTPNFTKGRTLSKKADDIIGDFYLRNPADILPRYITKATQKAEWSRRLGLRDPSAKVPKGEDAAEWRANPLGKWEDLKAKLEAEGNEKHIPEVVRTIKSITGNVGASSGTARGFVSLLRTWSALTYLPRATFASMSEPANIALRTGNTLDAARGYGRTLQHLLPIVRNAAGPKYLRAMAHDLGIIGDAIDNISMLQRVGNDDGSLWSRQIQSKFFKNIGLTQLTEANRMASVHIGMTYIRRLASDVATNSHYATLSRRLLQEMGVGANKLPGGNSDPVSAFASWVMDRDGKPNISDIHEGGPMGQLYHDTLGRFVAETVMAPTGATKPRYANHPLGSLLYNLQSFNYAFQKNVLNRIGAMTKNVADPELNFHEKAASLMPLMNVVPLLAITYGIGEIRDALFPDPARTGSPPMTAGDKAMRAVSRAGITGMMDAPYNALTGARYQRDPAVALAGPVYGGLEQGFADTLNLGSDRNTPNSNSMERKASKDLYQMVIQPTLIAGATGVAGETSLGTVLGAAAAFGISHPGMRELFVESVAGKKTPGKGVANGGYSASDFGGSAGGYSAKDFK